MSIIEDNKSTYSISEGKLKLKMYKQMTGPDEKVRVSEEKDEGLINSSEEISRINNVKVQNEILEEIHDTVCQELFNIVCSLHALSSSWQCMTQVEVTNKLNLITECSRAALFELRSMIYSQILAS